MKWIIQDKVFGSESDVLRQYLDTREKPAEDQFQITSPKVIIRGSVDWVLETKNNTGIEIKNVINLPAYTCSTYYQSVPTLNRDCIYLPWWQLKESKTVIRCFNHDWISNIADTKVFIRPNIGRKIFTGTTLSFKWWFKELEIIKSLPSSNIKDEDLVLISSRKNIDREYRVLMTGNKVIDWSIYEGEPEAGDEEKVKEICRNNVYFPDPAYIIDVGFFDDTPYIIELNAFASSGLYDMDPKKVVEGVEAAYAGIL